MYKTQKFLIVEVGPPHNPKEHCIRQNAEKRSGDNWTIYRKSSRKPTENMKNTIVHKNEIVQNAEIPDGTGQPPHNPEEHNIRRNAENCFGDPLDNIQKILGETNRKYEKHNCA